LSQKDWEIKSVSVSKEDKKYIARSGMNFSKFVRDCLRRHQAMQNMTEHQNENALERLGICPPNSRCVVCYPNGIPSPDSWKLFRGIRPEFRTTDRVDFDGSAKRYQGVEVGNVEWLLDSIEPEVNVGDLGSPGNAKTTRKAKKGLIRRFLAFIY